MRYKDKRYLRLAKSKNKRKEQLMIQLTKTFVGEGFKYSQEHV